MKKTSKNSKKGKVKAKPKIQPLGDKVLIKESSAENTARKTDSGIFIPDTVKEDKGAKKGKVVAVGEGKFENGKFIPVSVKAGDTVLFQWGDKINIDGEEYYIVRESEISAIIN
jgi:chaperonin GroES